MDNNSNRYPDRDEPHANSENDLSRFHSFVLGSQSVLDGIRAQCRRCLNYVRSVDKNRQKQRTIYINNHEVSSSLLPEKPHPQRFMDNTVTTSKYTAWNFFPKNLFEQFKRIANFYFLCVGAITLSLRDETPVNPFTSILPLLFVISVTAVKQGYEDWRRHKSDKDVNLKDTHVIREGKLMEVQSKEIKVGDLVHVEVDHSFPCDMLLITSSEESGCCYVTTANLDGETNLKKFRSLTVTQSYESVEGLNDLRGIIECEQPISDLYQFSGRLIIDDTKYPLGPENILLRGARLRDTAHVFGCAIYTGQETKMALNSKFKSAKFSRVERAMNMFLIVCLVFLVIECSVSVGLKYGLLNHPSYSNLTYLPSSDSVSEDPSARGVLINLLSFLILYNYIIPISLYVTIEIQKFIGSKYFSWDLKMYDPVKGLAKANTSDLNEELGQVQYLFSDKTGTLTENDMQFRQCFIAGNSYIDHKKQFCLIHKDSSIGWTPVPALSKEVIDFMLVLCLCHSCHIEKGTQIDVRQINKNIPNGSVYNYQASSPDEKAFLEAARSYGLVYHGIYDNQAYISYSDTMYKYSILHYLEFDSRRKRMSIIVRNNDGEIQLLCKGAESSLFDRVSGQYKEEIYKKIDHYGRLGLRTLAIAKKNLYGEEFKQIDVMIVQARTSITHRKEMLARAFEQIETNLTIIGATAVEDRLQEDVPQTIQSLYEAGIKVWVLTGDKEETAVNISKSAGHFMPGVVELRVTKLKSSEDVGKLMATLLNQLASNRELRISYSLVVDGYTLTFLLRDHRDIFRRVSNFCSAVLCCRLSPIQKAEVVRLIKYSRTKPVTAAIGDGANDVSMIQEAHVGLGIMGKEGRQAARSSDYCFAKFKFIRRALFFHGHLYYYRLAVLVQYFFYKNFAFITSQLYYIFFSAYSQQTLYQTFLLTFYNLTCTSLPIFIFSLFEQHIHQSALVKNPSLYKNVSCNKMLTWKNFFLWVSLGFYHSFISFFGIYFLIQSDVSLFSNGKAIDHFSFGSMVYTVCVFTVNAKLALETFYWCFPILISYIITIGGYFVLFFLHGSVIWPILFSNEMYGTFIQFMSSPSFWLALILLVFVSLLPDLLIRVHANRKIARIYKLKCTHERSVKVETNSVDGNIAKVDAKPSTQQSVLNVDVKSPTQRSVSNQDPSPQLELSVSEGIANSVLAADAERNSCSFVNDGFESEAA